jgi:type IV pilus assembly protein PilA
MSGRTQRGAREEGFTLVELLVVVLVIGILASIAIPAFLGQKKKAQDTAAKALLRSGVIALESYYVENPQQNFNGAVPALLADQEQNVNWQDATAPQPASAIEDEIDVALFGPVGDEDGYVLSTASKTGTIFSYTRDGNGVAYRCSGTTAANAVTGCAGTFAGGW